MRSQLQMSFSNLLWLKNMFYLVNDQSFTINDFCSFLCTYVCTQKVIIEWLINRNVNRKN